MIFKPKKCTWCSSEFTPLSAAQRRCDACRALTHAQAKRCPNCDSTVSGRDRWGADWGGECDRAEERVSELYRSLAR